MMNKSFDGKDDFISIGNHNGIHLDSSSLLNCLSRQAISENMANGETYWYERINDKWIFKQVKHEDVYDIIFMSPNPIAFISIYSRHLSEKEKSLIQDYYGKKLICGI